MIIVPEPGIQPDKKVLRPDTKIDRKSGASLLTYLKVSQSNTGTGTLIDKPIN
jgi:hypothetical protein